jgi:MYXO-CTERM domain-containing protein
VTLTDATYQPGFVGVLMTGLEGSENTGVDTTFDNFSAQSVPEPSSLVMASFGLGGVALALATRRRCTVA